MERHTDLLAAIQRIETAQTAFTTSAHGTIDRLTERLEELESKTNAPRKTAESETPESREHRQRFIAWMRKPQDSGTKAALSEFKSRSPSIKALSIGSGADGAYALPEEISRNVARLEQMLSPVRSLVNVVQCGSNDFKQLVSVGAAASAGWVGETDERTDTNTPQLRERAPSFGEIYAMPTCTEWALDDIFFNVQTWLEEETATQFALLEGDAVIRGDANKKPWGLLKTAPVATTDDASPLRDAAALQYIASLSTSSPAVAEITADALIDLCYATNSAYRSNGAWAMNSKSAGAISKLRDKEGRFLWMQSLVAGQPSTLLGYRVAILEGMDDIGAGKFPVAFGDWKRGYLLADRTQLRVLTDPYSSKGRVRYYIRRREGGDPVGKRRDQGSQMHCLIAGSTLRSTRSDQKTEKFPARPRIVDERSRKQGRNIVGGCCPETRQQPPPRP